MTQHFTLNEFTALDAARLPDLVLINLSRLMDLMEKVRTLCGDNVVTITSGYRSPEHNARIHGSRSSQHVSGEAADFVVSNVKAIEVWKTLLEATHLHDELGQVIVYGLDAKGEGEGTFVHISLSNEPRKLVGQFLWTESHGGGLGPYHRG